VFTRADPQRANYTKQQKRMKFMHEKSSNAAKLSGWRAELRSAKKKHSLKSPLAKRPLTLWQFIMC